MLYLPLKNIVIGYTEIGYIRTIIKGMLNLGSKILFLYKNSLYATVVRIYMKMY